MSNNPLKRLREEELLQNIVQHTPRLSESPLRLLQIVDKRIEQAANSQAEMIKTLLLETEHRLLTELDKRMCTMRRDIDNVTERVSKLETVADEIVTLKNEIKELKFQCLKNANSVVASDLRINGIPYVHGENLEGIFHDICNTINIPVPPLKSIFRLQNRNNKIVENSPDAVIIAKMMSPYDKNFFLKSLSNYMKLNKKNLMLNMLGFDSNKPFYVKENLTNSNYKILQNAVRLKKQNHLQSAYTYRGLVYVKRLRTDDPICIEHIADLDHFFRDHAVPDELVTVQPNMSLNTTS